LLLDSSKRSSFAYLPVLTGLFTTTLLVTNVLNCKIIRVGPLPMSGGLILFPLKALFGDVWLRSTLMLSTLPLIEEKIARLYERAQRDGQNCSSGKKSKERNLHHNVWSSSDEQSRHGKRQNNASLIFLERVERARSMNAQQ